MNMKEFLMACKLVTNFKNNPEATETTAAEKAEKVRQAAAQVAKSKQARLKRTQEQNDADLVAALKATADKEAAERLAAERAEINKVKMEKTAAERAARGKAAAEMDVALQKAKEEAAAAAAELDAAQALAETMKASEVAAAAARGGGGGGGDDDLEYASDYVPPEDDDAGEDEYVDVSTINHEGVDGLDDEAEEEAKSLRKAKKKREKEYGEDMSEVWSKPPVVNGRCTECHSKEAWCMCTKKRGFQANIQGVALEGLEGLMNSGGKNSDGEDSDDPDSDEDPVSPDWQLQQRLGIGSGSAGDGGDAGGSSRDRDSSSGSPPSFKTPEASPAAAGIGVDGASSDDPEDSDDDDDGDAKGNAGGGSKPSMQRVLMLDDGGAAAGDSSTDAGERGAAAAASCGTSANLDDGAASILGLLRGIAGVTAAESSSDDATGAVAAAAAAAFKAPLSVRDVEINAASAAIAAGNPLWVRSQSTAASSLFSKYADRFLNKAAACDPDLPSTTPKGHLFSYTRGQSISASLKRLDGGKKVSTLAIQAYTKLAQHVRGEMLPADSVPFIRTAVTHCLNSEDFRGELLCQLVRQSNGNPSIDQQLRCWHLMCVFCSSFPAGEGLAEPLEMYATDRRRHAAASAGAAQREVSNPTPLLKTGATALTAPAVVVQQQQELHAKLCKLEQYAASVVQALEKVAKCGARRNAPGICIIEALRTQTPILRRFYFITGDSAAVSIDPLSTTTEVAEAVARTVGLESAQGWALFETTPQAEHWIRDTEYIADVLTEWEEATKPTGGQAEGEKEKTAKRTKFGAKFVFRKRLFFAGEQLSMDDEATARLLFAQAVHSVTRADEYGVSADTALQLAGLQAQVKYGNPDYQEPNPEWYSDVLSFVPWRITAEDPMQASREQWSSKIFEAHVEHGSGKATKEAMMLFLAAIRLYPLFGAAQFDVICNGGAGLPDRLFLAVDARGIKFVDHQSRAILPGRSYAYSQLMSVEVSLDKEVIALIMVDDIDDETEDKQRFLFRCLDAENIANLIGSYSPTHQDWTHGKHSSNAAAKLQHQKEAASVRELQRRNGEIIAARTNMACNGYMLPPPQPKSMMTKLQKRLSRRSSRAKSYAGNFEDDTQYPDSFWEFQKVPVAQPLLFVVSPESAELAVNSFNTLLVYAGIMEQAVPEPDVAITAGLAGGGVVVQDPIAAAAAAAAAAAVNDPNHVLLVQNMLSATLEKEECCNEFYMQLIKQTTRCPPPTPPVHVGGGGMGGKSNSGSEMVEASNRLTPSITSSGADVGMQNWRIFATAVGVVLPRHTGIVRLIDAHIARHIIDPNPEIAAAAKFVAQTYARTVENKNRKHPPSQVEVLCRTRQLPIYSNVYLAGGKSRTISFDPASNTAEVVGMLKEQLGLPDKTIGFSIFEVFGELERNMLPWEKLADAMFKWDRYSEHVEHSRNAAALASGQAASRAEKQKLELTYKRRLFLGPFTVPLNPVEFTLTVDQAVDDVQNDRFPVTVDDATMLVAIRAQALLGDCDVAANAEVGEYEADGAASGTYASVLKATLPLDIAKSLGTPEIANQHRKLQGRDVAQCNTLFLNRVMGWPLYGASIFEVQQAFTSELPGKFWLAINEDGIHALRKRGKTPLTFYSYRSIVNYSPSMKELKIVVAPATADDEPEKLLFRTRQASQIAHLIKDYTHIIIQQVQSGASPKGSKSKSRAKSRRNSGHGGGGRDGDIVTPISKYVAGGKSPTRSQQGGGKKDIAVPKKLMLEPVVEAEMLTGTKSSAAEETFFGSTAATATMEEKALDDAVSAAIAGSSKKSVAADSTFFGPDDAVSAAIVGGSKKSVAADDTFFGPSDSPDTDVAGGGGGNGSSGRATTTTLSSPKAGGATTSSLPSSPASSIAASALAAVVLQSGNNPGVEADNGLEAPPARSKSNTSNDGALPPVDDEAPQSCFAKVFATCFGGSGAEG